MSAYTLGASWCCVAGRYFGHIALYWDHAFVRSVWNCPHTHTSRLAAEKCAKRHMPVARRRVQA